MGVNCSFLSGIERAVHCNSSNLGVSTYVLKIFRLVCIQLFQQGTSNPCSKVLNRAYILRTIDSHMSFILRTDNAIDYLIQNRICSAEFSRDSMVEPKIFKNFNVLVQLADNRRFLVKQESGNRRGKSDSGLIHEWRLYQLLRSQLELSKSELSNIAALVSELIHADPDNAVLVLKYLDHYQDLDTFADQGHFPACIARELGATLATVHRVTFEHRDALRAAIVHLGYDARTLDEVPDFQDGLETITPDVFGEIAADGLKFYELYQRHDQLRQAMTALNDGFAPCCLTHNDLKFNNVLLHHQWKTLLQHEADGQPLQATIRFIDWEKWSWGDPAYDVGMVIAEFLKLWLKSLVVSPDLDLHTSLRFATVPLEVLQPSLIALIEAYQTGFPELWAMRPAVLTQIVQCAGLALIETIQARLYYLEPFGNVEICMLQVAKTLLCEPEQSVSMIFGQPLSSVA